MIQDHEILQGVPKLIKRKQIHEIIFFFCSTLIVSDKWIKETRSWHFSKKILEDEFSDILLDMCLSWTLINSNNSYVVVQKDSHSRLVTQIIDKYSVW